VSGKSSLTVLQKDIITSGSVNAYEVKFQFDNDWDDLERIAVFRVGKKSVSIALDDANTCKIPWECVCENDIGKEVLVGVYGMVDTTVVLPTVWAGLGNLKEGCRLGSTALPATPSVAEQILAQIISVRDEVFAAIRANGGIIPDVGGGSEESKPEPDTGNTEDEPTGDGDVATDDEVNDALDGIFG
jgi:hypothetical protein